MYTQRIIGDNLVIMITNPTDEDITLGMEIIEWVQGHMKENL